MNEIPTGSGYLATFTPKSIGLEHANGYAVTEVFENKFMQNVLPNQYITIRVNPSGTPSQTYFFSSIKCVINSHLRNGNSCKIFI